jgi:hypothetical protein
MTAHVGKMWPAVLRHVVQWQSEALRGREDDGRVKVVWKRVQWHVAVSVIISLFDGGKEIAIAGTG